MSGFFRLHADRIGTDFGIPFSLDKDEGLAKRRWIDLTLIAHRFFAGFHENEFRDRAITCGTRKRSP